MAVRTVEVSSQLLARWRGPAAAGSTGGMLEAHCSVSAVLLLGVDDPEWGQRLVALVGSAEGSVLQRLEALTRPWPPAETPRRWLLCPALAPSALGKWQPRPGRDRLQRLASAEA